MAYTAEGDVKANGDGSATFIYRIQKVTLRTVKHSDIISKFIQPSGELTMTEADAEADFWASGSAASASINPCTSACNRISNVPTTKYYWYDPGSKRYQRAVAQPCQPYVTPQQVLLP